MTAEAPQVISIYPPLLKANLTARLTGLALPQSPIVEIDGAIAEVIDSSQQDIWFKTPSTARSGHRLLFVRSNGLTLRHPVEIVGDAQIPNDARTAPVTDATTSPPDSGPADPVEPARLTGRFTADPIEAGAIRMQVVEHQGNELTLEVVLPPDDRLRASAFHLIFDKNIMRYKAARPTNAADIFKAELIADNRLAIGWILSDDALSISQLTFELVGVGEARLDFPALHRTARDQRNQPVRALNWSAGSVRVSEESP
ncbi:MAG: hypothetical protein ACON3Z_05635 [Bradymonadia bacterium]